MKRRATWANTRRILILPGEVVSQNDGQRHFVGEAELRRLYCVGKHERVTVVDPARGVNGHGLRVEDFDLICKPRFDGNYPLFRPPRNSAFAGVPFTLPEPEPVKKPVTKETFTILKVRARLCNIPTIKFSSFTRKKRSWVWDTREDLVKPWNVGMPAWGIPATKIGDEPMPLEIAAWFFSSVKNLHFQITTLEDEIPF